MRLEFNFVKEMLSQLCKTQRVEISVHDDNGDFALSCVELCSVGAEVGVCTLHPERYSAARQTALKSYGADLHLKTNIGADGELFILAPATAEGYSTVGFSSVRTGLRYTLYEEGIGFCDDIDGYAKYANIPKITFAAAVYGETGDERLILTVPEHLNCAGKKLYLNNA